MNGSSFAIEYGTGSLKGVISSDLLQVGGVQVKNQLFAESVQEPGNTFLMAGMDGIMGMGYSTISVNGIPTPLENMVAQGLIDDPIVSFYLNHANPYGSEMVLGGYNPDRIQGEINWHPVIRRGYWEIGMDAMYFGETSIPLVDTTAVVDTGTSLIAVSKPIADALYKQMGGFPFINGLHVIRCNRALDLTFIMNGKTYILKGSEYVIPMPFGFCAVGIMGMDLPRNIFILGDMFLRKYYSIYDMKHDRVGLTQAVQPDQ